MAHIDDQTTQQANLRYIRQTMKSPMLDREHEQKLARAWRDKKDEHALHELVNAYARLVVSTASRFRHYGLPIGDLIQEGNIGLMQAAERFDPDREVRFSTYASWWIRSAIQDYVLRNWSIVRTGTTAAQKALFFNLRRLRARIEGKKPGDGLDSAGREEIAKKLKVKLKDVEEMEARLSGADHSLNSHISDSGEDEWQELLADERPTPEDIVIGMRDAETRSRWLNEALGELSDREKTIISQRRLTHEAVTLEDLGKELGVSKERVRQLEQRALGKIRESITRHVEAYDDLLIEA